MLLPQVIRILIVFIYYCENVPLLPYVAQLVFFKAALSSVVCTNFGTSASITHKQVFWRGTHTVQTAVLEQTKLATGPSAQDGTVRHGRPKFDSSGPDSRLQSGLQPGPGLSPVPDRAGAARQRQQRQGPYIKDEGEAQSTSLTRKRGRWGGPGARAAVRDCDRTYLRGPLLSLKKWTSNGPRLN